MSACFSLPFRLGRWSLAVMLVCGATVAAAADTASDRANRGVIEILTGGGDGSSIQMIEDIGSVVDDVGNRRVLPVVGVGSVQNLIDLKTLRGIDVGIVHTDELDYAKQNKIIPSIESALYYVAKLHNEELHLLAGSGIKSVTDLAGRKVDFVGSAGITGTSVLGILNIKVEALYDNHAVALQKLRAGEIAALAYVAAKPTSLFEALPSGEGFHFLPIPLKTELTNSYVPARLGNEDYPSLIAADAPVDTVAVGAVMVVANLPTNTDRYRAVSDFADAFFTQFPHLQDASHHPKWAEVNLAADLPGWHRFPPSEQWLKRNVVALAPQVDDKELRDIFSKFLDERIRSSGGSTMSSKEKDKLYDQFRHWQTSQIR